MESPSLISKLCFGGVGVSLVSILNSAPKKSLRSADRERKGKTEHHFSEFILKDEGL